MKVMVLGANGYIGRNIIRKLVDLNCSVTGVSRCAPVNTVPGTQWITANIASVENLEKLSGLADVIVDCISYVNPNESDLSWSVIRDIVKHYKNFLNVLCKGKKYIFISSGGTVYGQAGRIPTPETAALSPLTPYAIQKVVQEQEIRKVLKHEHYHILRTANPYGIDQEVKYNVGLIPRVLHCINNGSSIPLTVPLDTVRDYIHIQDVIRYIVSFIINNHEYGTYNLGSGRGVSIGEVIRLVEKVSCKSASYTIDKHALPFIHTSVLCCEKIMNETKIRPAICLEDGLALLQADWITSIKSGINQRHVI